MAKLMVTICACVLLSACNHTSVKKITNLLEQQIEADNYYAQDQCEKALPLYKELSQAMLTDTNSLLRMGNCYAREQNYSQAERAYILALERDPSFIKAWYNLSYIRARILARTVSEMYKNVDPSSEDAEKIRALTVDILAPFNLELDMQHE